MTAGQLARVAGLVLVCLLVFLPGISGLPVTDRDEARFAQASRQMIESGDYLDIRFQDVPRYKKPIGIYWLQAAAAGVTGHAGDPPIWSFRLVSFVGALAAALATMWIATTFFGISAGFVAGCAIAAAFGLGLEARIAKTDAFLLGVTVLAQGALAQLYLAYRERRSPPSYAPWLFWVAQGIGILIKGPVTPLVSLLTVFALLLCDRKRGWVRSLRFRPGLVIILLLVAPWLAAITWKSGGAFWSEAVGRDLLGKVAEGQESHGFPPGYYSITYSLFLWPIGYLGLLAGLNVLNRARLDPRMLFLLAWYVPLWIVLELVPTKLPHYMLPAYPVAAIALGWFLTYRDSIGIPLAAWQKWLAYLGLFGLGLVTLALAAFPLVLTGYFGGGGWAVAGLASFAALIAGLLGSPLGGRVPVMLRVPGMALLAGAFFGLSTGVVLPGIDAIWVSREITKVYSAGKPCTDSSLTLVGYEEPSIVFLAGTRTRFAGADAAAAKLAADAKCAVVAVTTKNTDAFLTAATALHIAPKPIGTVNGLDYSNGHDVDATLYVAKW